MKSPLLLASAIVLVLAAPALAQAPSDPLSDVLQAVRLTGALFFRVEASRP